MTLTPAIKEALDEFARLSALPLGPLGQDYRNVLSVVAAEEGRKYEELVKLVKEWQEARNNIGHGVDWLPDLAPGLLSQSALRKAEVDAERALLQWEAK